MTLIRRVLWAWAVNLLLINLLPGATNSAQGTDVAGTNVDRVQAIAALEAAVRHDKQVMDELPKGSREADAATTRLERAYEVLGIAYLGDGRYIEAAATLSSAIDLSRDGLKREPVDALYARSIAYSRSNRAQDAISDLEKILAVRDDIHYREELAIALAQVGKRGAAIEQYKTLLQRQPDDAWLNLQIGYLYIQEHNYSEAARAYEKAVVNQRQLTPPLIADLYDNLGLAYYHLCRREESIAAFTKAAAMNPEFAEGLGIAYLLKCNHP